MICIAFMWYWSKKITILNILEVLKKHNATLYNIVAAQHQKVHHYNSWLHTGCAMVSIS